MDYLVYYEPETGQLGPLEYDGNTTFQPDLANSLIWGPFKNSTNTNYPLLSKMMADNSETITDEDGKYEDWIELFNANNFEMNLDGYYLSDDQAEPQKWQFPDGTIIPANGYLIVWADDDQADG